MSKTEEASQAHEVMLAARLDYNHLLSVESDRFNQVKAERARYLDVATGDPGAELHQRERYSDTQLAHIKAVRALVEARRAYDKAANAASIAWVAALGDMRNDSAYRSAGHSDPVRTCPTCNR